MTPEELLSIGCKTMHWNPKYNGGFFEYYLAITGNGMGLKDTRLSVTFGGFAGPEYEYLAWIVSPNNRFGLLHVKTIEQFKQMYILLTGKKDAFDNDGDCNPR